MWRLAPQRCLHLCLLFVLCAACQGNSKEKQLESLVASSAVDAAQPIASDRACSYFYFLWGRQAELALRFDVALQAYEKAVICDPNAAYAQEKIPLLLLKMERNGEAEEWLRIRLERHPGKSELRMLYAKVLSRQKKTQLAAEQYRLIAERHPNDPGLMLPLAEMYFSNGQTNEARPILERLLGLDPELYAANVLMGRVLRQEDQLKQAISAYQKALKHNWSAEIEIELAELLVQDGQLAEAETLYRQIIAQEEENESAYLGLLRLFLLQNKDEQALASLQQLRLITDNVTWVDLAIARLYAKQNKLPEAKALLQGLIKQENASEARYLLASLLAQDKQFEAALRQVRQIQYNDAEFLEALALQVRILSHLKRESEAVQLLERHLSSRKSRHPMLYLMLAELHQQHGRILVAQKVLERGLQRHPVDEDLLYAQAFILEKNGDHASALRNMEKILALNPDNAAALNYIGYSWVEKKTNLEQALAYLQRAVKLQPQEASIRDSLGWAYYQLGKLEEALAELEQAAKLNPTNAETLEHLAQAYMKSDKTSQALRIYKRLLHIYLDIENKVAIQRVRKQILLLESPGTP